MLDDPGKGPRGTWPAWAIALSLALMALVFYLSYSLARREGAFGLSLDLTMLGIPACLGIICAIAVIVRRARRAPP